MKMLKDMQGEFFPQTTSALNAMVSYRKTIKTKSSTTVLTFVEQVGIMLIV